MGCDSLKALPHDASASLVFGTREFTQQPVRDKIKHVGRAYTGIECSKGTINVHIMPASLKSFLHMAVGLVLGIISIHHPATFDVTIFAAISWGLNWVLSHTVPTTTGASATQ